MGVLHNHQHNDIGSMTCAHGSSTSNIAFALVLNLSFCLIEFVGGVLTGSMAILSDALHDFGDALSLASALFLEKLADKKSDYRFSYGYRRFSLVSALITGAVLFIGSIVILGASLQRLSQPQLPHAPGMIGLAVLGVAVNGFAAWRMWRGHTLNEKMLTWHLMEDLFGWVVVLIGSFIIAWTQWAIIDPLLSIGFTMVILWGVIKNLLETVKIFLQGIPAALSSERIKEIVLSQDHIKDIHDLHVWSLDGKHHVVTFHVVVAPQLNLAQISEIKKRLKESLQSLGDVHATIEVETDVDICSQKDCAPSYLL